MTFTKRLMKRVKYHGNFIQRNKIRKITSNYHINGYERIYHYHIRKTGGTSINSILMSNYNDGTYGRRNVRKIEEMNNKWNILIDEDKVYVAWNKYLIEKGNYYYAYSHCPSHQLDIPPNTFTLTCLRHPIDRVISHYKMLLSYKENNPLDPCFRRERHYLGSSFCDFVNNLPKEHLLRQLYMFSDKFDEEEAIERILDCSIYLFTENMAIGLKELSFKLGFPMGETFQHKSIVDYFVDDSEREKLEDVLGDEIKMYNRLWSLKFSK